MSSDPSSYKVAIIGSGPAGLSAAARAAELGIPHILIESAPDISNTVNFWYQKGKHVMDEPANMPLRSSTKFEEGTREQVLQAWKDDIDRLKINLRFNTALKAITGDAGAFEVLLANGEVLKAQSVVLAIGTMGNIRKLGIPGEDHPAVAYKLDDASLLKGQQIIVVGAGDSAIEDALALSKNNKVTVINRREGFDRAKSRNAAAILRAIQNKEIDCIYGGVPESVLARTGEGASAEMIVESANGSVTVPADLIIIRAGAMPQRKLLDSLGVGFPNEAETAFPIIGEGYQSTRAGIYIVGALAGCPLIKEAMNQGYEAIEFIEGRTIDPADQGLLEDVLKNLPDYRGVKEALADLKTNVPMLSEVTTLVLREYVRESELLFLKAGEVLYKPGDYAQGISAILKGSLALSRDGNASERDYRYTVGSLQGLTSIKSGLPQDIWAIAVEDTVLLETPLRASQKLFNSVDSIKKTIDHIFTRRILLRSFVTLLPEDSVLEDINEMHFDALAGDVELLSLKAGQVVYQEGSVTDAFYIVRNGAITLSRDFEGKTQVQHLISTGEWFGNDEIFLGGNRLDTATTTSRTEILKLDASKLMAVLARYPSIQHAAERRARNMLLKEQQKSTETNTSAVISFLDETGVVEGTNVLVIDESLCVRCDNCEKACAETHGGISRLNRKAGDTFATIHVPVACRHCYDPSCMKDCPPDAISRQADGDISINANTCIGCGNCVANCPFGVVQLVATKPQEPTSLLSWLLFGKGRPPGQETEHLHDGTTSKKAVKCDLCVHQASGPACVQACPTGAALRKSPDQLVKIFEASHLNH